MKGNLNESNGLLWKALATLPSDPAIAATLETSVNIFLAFNFMQEGKPEQAERYPQ